MAEFVSPPLPVFNVTHCRRTGGPSRRAQPLSTTSSASTSLTTPPVSVASRTRPRREFHSLIICRCVAPSDRSLCSTTNPLRYSSLQTLREVHGTWPTPSRCCTTLLTCHDTTDIGEVWANTLHNVYAALVRVHGFSATAHTDPT